MISVRFATLLGSIPSPGTDRLEVGPLTFRFYGLMIAFGVLAGVEIARRRWAERGGDPDDIIEIAKWAVPAGLIGSRIYHVATDWKSYQGDWFRALEIWKGGLGIPGGLIAGVLAGAIYARHRGWSVTGLLDASIPGIPVAQAIGRLGNWFNQEIFGGPTDLPWAVEIAERHRPAEFLAEPTFHPTFLYEALWNLALAWVLIRLDKQKRLRPGQILPLWIVGYGVGRFLVEGVRIDAASEILGIRVNHWVSALAVLGGGIWFLMLSRRPEPVEDPHDLDELELDVPSVVVDDDVPAFGDGETPDHSGTESAT